MKVEATDITTDEWRGGKAVALKGAMLSAVHVDKAKNTVYLTTDRGIFRFWHETDCCESVTLETFDGWHPVSEPVEVRVAEERVVEGLARTSREESCTSTHYAIRTIGPDLVMMWHGESNGEYSEGVTVDLVDEVPDSAVDADD